MQIFNLNDKDKKGFTLAEVLITIGIIGVVAAITIPALQSNIQKQQFKSGAKKAYNQLSNAIELVKQDEGGKIPIGFYFSSGAFKNAIVKKMNVTIDGTYNIAGLAFTPSLGNLNGYGSMIYEDDGQWVTTDGMFYAFDCDRPSFAVDVNGYKEGPNKWGWDVFEFYIDSTNDKLIPMGAPGTPLLASVYCIRGSNSSLFMGMGCMYYVMQGIDY